MTMYDGAENPSTTPCTLVATSNTTPSPQVCSSDPVADTEPYNSYHAFDQGDANFYVGYAPWNIMVDRGAGNTVLINKYKILHDTTSGTELAWPRTWQLQGSSEVGAVASDAIGSANWHTLDSRTNAAALIDTWITFINDTAYSKFRLYVPEGNYGNGQEYICLINELILVAQPISILGDADESIESTDAVSGYVAITADVSESSASTDTVDGTKSFETVDIDETTASTDTVEVFQNSSISDVSETTEAVDTVTAALYFYGDVSESSAGSDSIEAHDTFILPVIVESSSSSDTVECTKWTGANITVSDSLLLLDAVEFDCYILIAETLGLSDAATSILGILIHDYLKAVDIQTVNQSGTKFISEALALSDAAYSALHLSIADTIALADTPTVTLCLSILEHLRFDELVTAIGRLSHGVSDTITMQDSLAFGFSQAVSEALSVVDTASVIGALLNSIAESLVLADTATNQANVNLPVSEALTIADTVSSQGVLYNIIYDTLGLNVTVEVDGETWECYVLNTPKFLPSVYSGFNYNSYCVFDNRAYGCKSTAIDELTGDTDNGVAFHTGVQLPETRFGIPNQKRFQKAYVGVSGTKPKMVMQTEDGSKKVYSIDSEGEVDTSSALQGKKWRLTVTDFDTLDFIKLYPVVLSK